MGSLAGLRTGGAAGFLGVLARGGLDGLPLKAGIPMARRITPPRPTRAHWSQGVLTDEAAGVAEGAGAVPAAVETEIPP